MNSSNKISKNDNPSRANGTIGKLFKLIGFYQIVDPGSTKVFGFNVYNLCHILSIVLVTAVVVVGYYGMAVNPGNGLADNNSIKVAQSVFCFTFIMFGNLKLFLIIRNAETIWNVLSVTQETFLSSEQCTMGRHKLIRCGKHFARSTFAFYVSIYSFACVLWVITPIIMNDYVISDQTRRLANAHKSNMVNLRYPISVETYNAYFVVFYTVESFIVIFCTYGSVVYDVFLIAILQYMSTQYDIIASAYENLKSVAESGEDESTFSSEKCIKELMSIMDDCQKMFKKIQVFYEISWPVVMICMFGGVIAMVTMPFLTIRCFQQSGSSILKIDAITFAGTYLCVLMQSYFYCSLFQNLNEKRESVNFGLYSCEWTSASVLIRKLLLLTMRMNNSNRLKMKITSNKSVDLQMLASIIRSSYNITSVMINKIK